MISYQSNGNKQLQDYPVYKKFFQTQDLNLTTKIDNSNTKVSVLTRNLEIDKEYRLFDSAVTYTGTSQRSMKSMQNI